jgi:hypothetical protein
MITNLNSWGKYSEKSSNNLNYSVSFNKFCDFSCTFAAVKLDTKRHIASWLLLAVFVPMLVLSSLHVHGDSSSMAETECADCVHHSCHGHLTATASWAHDCVLCQFQLLKMLAAAVIAVTVFIHVCRKYHAQPLCGYHAACYGIIVTRGPPSAWIIKEAF